MRQTITVGGNRLGSGKKMKQTLHDYGDSKHNTSYSFKSSMCCGTLIPFTVGFLRPGEKTPLDIAKHMIRTHPTVGPLYGSYKLQLDLFKAPVRFYNRLLHDNTMEIAMDIGQVLYPIHKITVPNPNLTEGNLNQQQVNPSSLLAYLGTRGFGVNRNENAPDTIKSDFMAIPELMYWEIYKTYYANKQEGVGQVIVPPSSTSMFAYADVCRYYPTTATGTGTVQSMINIWMNVPGDNAGTWQGISNQGLTSPIAEGTKATTNWSIVLQGRNLNAENIHLRIGLDNSTHVSTTRTLQECADAGLLRYVIQNGGNQVRMYGEAGIDEAFFLYYANGFWAITVIPFGTQEVEIGIEEFDLKNIDKMRQAILGADMTVPFDVAAQNLSPYTALSRQINTPDLGVKAGCFFPMVGLGLKTYMNDRFNNWIKTDWIDGENGVTELSNIDVSDGTLSANSLLIQKAVFNLMNRYAISGGDYKSWLEASFSRPSYGALEIPTYCGGVSAEIVFNEIISTSDSETPSGENQPLGTLGGRGTQAEQKGKGGTIEANEVCFYMGIISITPRIDYSQGNKWWTRMRDMSEMHFPSYDGIGFQELLTDEMAAWDTDTDENGVRTYRSVGKQPAWTEYTTAENENYGNFANNGSEAFMTLGRRYQPDENGRIADLTTYVDPTKFNYLFATTGLSSQHFWVWINIEATTTRVMSANQMPIL